MAMNFLSRSSGWLAAGISGLLFATACSLPALHFIKDGKEPLAYPGSALLLLGALATLVGNFAWIANAFYASSLTALIARRWGLATIMATIALAFASLTFQLFGQEIPFDQAGDNKVKLESLGPGFYFWVASMIAAAVIGIWARLSNRTKSNP